MNYKIFLRVAAGFLWLFAIGHAVGLAAQHLTENVQAQEVLGVMAGHKFAMFGELRSYDEIHTGISINLILTLLTFGVILWGVSNGQDMTPTRMNAVLLPVLFCIIGFGITSMLYFFLIPAFVCLLVSIAIASALMQVNRP
jgi:hypothetical protein